MNEKRIRQYARFHIQMKIKEVKLICKKDKECKYWPTVLLALENDLKEFDKYVKKINK